MAAMVTLEEAKAHLPDNQQSVARLLPVKSQPQRKLGTMRGSVHYIAPDFDEPLDDFKDYM